MKKILLLSVLSIGFIVQSVIAQNNYRDFEITIDTSEYRFTSSNDYLDVVNDEEWIEPNITDIRGGRPFLDNGNPSIPYKSASIILPYHKVIDSCVLTLHGVHVWKENITLSSVSDSGYFYIPSNGLLKKSYPDGIYPSTDKRFEFENDMSYYLPLAVFDFSPFIYDSYQKTLKIATSATVRIYYKEGELSRFTMEELDEYAMALDYVLNPEDLDEYIKWADAPIDEISSGMTLSQSGRECTFQFAQPLSENATLQLFRANGTLYRTILIEQGATSLAVTLDDLGMYLYCMQNRKGKIIITD